MIGGGFGNCSGEDGGAIGGSGSLDVNGVVFIDNTASFVGGAIYCNGSTITDSTVTGNSASNNGGGIYFNAGSATLTNDTIDDNIAPSGATGAGVNVGFASLLMNNTIVAQNMAGASEADLGSIGGPIGGTVSSSSSHNLIGDTTFSSISNGSNGNLVGTSGAPINAMLASPGINGGPVVSQALETGSPAIGAGLVANAVDPTTSDPLQFDQRGMGFPRVVNNSVDIGSFQTQSTVVASTLTVATASGTYGGTRTLTATLTSGGDPIAGELVDIHLGSIDLGTMTTDVNGVATFTNVSLGAFNVGSYTGAISAGFDGDSNFTASSGSANLTVTPAPLTITADDQSKVYGAALPTLTASYTGFVNGDTAASLTTAPTIFTTATAASHVSGSPYAITASGAVDSNYTISYVAGSLTVTTAPLTITANDQTKVYGDALPTLTASYTGFVNGDTRRAEHSAHAHHHRHGHQRRLGQSLRHHGQRRRGSRLHDQLCERQPDHHPGPADGRVDNLTKVYGQVNPALTGTVTGIAQRRRRHGRLRHHGHPVQRRQPAATHHLNGLSGPRQATTPRPSPAASVTPGSLTVTPAPLSIVADNRPRSTARPTPPSPAPSAASSTATTSRPTTPPRPTSSATSSPAATPSPRRSDRAKAGDYSTAVAGASFTPGILT